MALSLAGAIWKKLTQGIYSGSCRWNIDFILYYIIDDFVLKKPIKEK